MKGGQFPLGVSQRRDDVRIGSIPGTGLSRPACPRPGVTDMQKHLLDLA